MTDAEKIAMVKALLNDTTVPDATVSVYLTLSEERIKKSEYPFGNGTEAMSDKYEMEQCELAMRMLARRGFEGQVDSNENGIIRAWATEDDTDILKRITPKVGF